MISTHKRIKILIDILKVFGVFKSLFDLEDFNQDINSTFSDFVVHAMNT